MLPWTLLMKAPDVGLTKEAKEGEKYFVLVCKGGLASVNGEYVRQTKFKPESLDTCWFLGLFNSF